VRCLSESGEGGERCFSLPGTRSENCPGKVFPFIGGPDTGKYQTNSLSLSLFLSVSLATNECAPRIEEPKISVPVLTSLQPTRYTSLGEAGWKPFKASVRSTAFSAS